MVSNAGRSGTIRALGALLLSCSLVPAAGDVLAGSPAAAGLGRLQGTVTLGRTLAAHRMRFSLYPDANRAGNGAEPVPAGSELQNVVIYLEHTPAGAAPPEQPQGPFRMEQEGLTFKPHVLPVVKGSVVEFPNRDMLFHNVFSLSKAASFDLGRYPKEGSKSLKFTTPGIIQVFCHIHSDMSGVIVVLDNPFFASPDTSGRFVIDGIPAGEYRVVAWHERARLASKVIRIEAGKDTDLDFNIPLNEDSRGG